MIGVDLMYNVCILFISSSVPHHQQSLAGGIFNTVQQISVSFGLAIASAVAATMSASSGFEHDSVERFMVGFRGAFWTFTALGVVSVVLSLFAKVGIVGARRKMPDEMVEVQVEPVR